MKTFNDIKREAIALSKTHTLNAILDHLHAKGLLMVWQPIETAPKDGQDVLLFFDGLYAVCFWDGYNWLSSIQSGSDEYSPLTMDRATHFMPLPSAPKGENND